MRVQKRSVNYLEHCVPFSSNILLWTYWLTVRWIEDEEMRRRGGGGGGWELIVVEKRDGGRMRMEQKTHCHSFALTRNFRQRVVRRENSPLMKAPTKIVAVPVCLKDLPLMMMNWCLMSSDVMRHIRDKLWPMPKRGAINLYVHGNQKAR